MSRCIAGDVKSPFLFGGGMLGSVIGGARVSRTLQRNHLSRVLSVTWHNLGTRIVPSGAFHRSGILEVAT